MTLEGSGSGLIGKPVKHTPEHKFLKKKEGDTT
jgi:hypothetical protein